MRVNKWLLAAPLLLLALFALPGDAFAQATEPTLDINLGTGEGLTARVLQLTALITVLSLAPSILIMTTSFVRIVVVLSLLRTAIGLQQAPPNVVIVSLSLFLTAFVMQPVWTQAYETGIGPVMREEMELDEAFPRIVEPLKIFMAGQTREADLALFIDMAQPRNPARKRGRHAAARPRAGVHDLGAQARVRDRLYAVRAVPDHRPRGLVAADGHGHDDDAARDDQLAVQADLLRAGGRLAAGGGQPDRELRVGRPAGRIATRYSLNY